MKIKIFSLEICVYALPDTNSSCAKSNARKGINYERASKKQLVRNTYKRQNFFGRYGSVRNYRSYHVSQSAGTYHQGRVVKCVFKLL